MTDEKYKDVYKETTEYVALANYHIATDPMWQMSLIEIPGKEDRNHTCKSEIN